MRVSRVTARGYRNLADLVLDVPPAGAALLGRNGHGKTNVLEALTYPVLFRSFRGAPDADVAAHGGPGFAVTVAVDGPAGAHDVSAIYRRGGRPPKELAVDGAPIARLADGIGTWLAVAFLPEDTALASGGAAVRRAYLDRMLSLADGRYLQALSRYRAALAQRNAALKQRREAVARAFEAPLAVHGSAVTAARLAWAAPAEGRLAEELAAIGEPGRVALRYAGHAALADPAAWPAALDGARDRDAARGATSVGPHRDDLELLLGGRALREFGSTGQQRSAAIALRLLELETLRDARHDEPALVLDDVFAELDGERQRQLAARVLANGRQVFVSAPRRDELPDALALAVWTVTSGTVRVA